MNIVQQHVYAQHFNNHHVTTTQICSQHYVSIQHMHNTKKMEFFYFILLGTPEYVIEVFNNLKNEHL